MQSCYVDSPEGDTLLDADAVVDIDIGYATAIFALAFQEFVYRRDETIRYDTIRDAILTCARKPT